MRQKNKNEKRKMQRGVCVAYRCNSSQKVSGKIPSWIIVSDLTDFYSDGFQIVNPLRHDEEALALATFFPEFVQIFQ